MRDTCFYFSHNKCFIMEPQVCCLEHQWIEIVVKATKMQCANAPKGLKMKPGRH